MTQKEYWECSKEELLESFAVTEEGLSAGEAEKIRQEKGDNVLQEEKKKSVLQVFWWQQEFPCFPAMWRAP